MLVAYASKYGGTAGIAEAIGDTIRSAGLEANVTPVSEADVAGFDAVVLGSSLYGGSWLGGALQFAHDHSTALREIPCWIFSSGPLGDVEPLIEEQPSELAELTHLLEPRWHTMFSGILDPEKLSFGERAMMRAVKAQAGDYRDWKRIRALAREIAADILAGEASPT